MSVVDDAVHTMIRNLEGKTGKSLAAWLQIARATKLVKHGALMKLLKGEHGLTHGYANLIALKALESISGSPGVGDPVGTQYAGDKIKMRPVYDSLIAAISKFGDDIEVAPKKAYVSLRRKKQFALVQPSTASRVDVGIKLKGAPLSGRLEASGSFNAMVSHRVRLGGPKDVDKELIGWLKKAYDQA